ncbi:MAG: metallophosphoesterase [Candidatus Promineifilaceae bacterium]
MLSTLVNWPQTLLQNKWIRASLTVLTSASVALYSYFRHVEPNQLVIERVEIPVPDLPPEMSGFTIAQLSDIHYLPHTKMPLVKRAIAKTNALNPDLIVLTGDFISKKVDPLFELVEALAELKAPHGVLAILGNHDTSLWKPHVREIMRYAFAHHSIPLLVNQHVTLSNGLVIAGLDEIHHGRPNLKRTLEGVPEDAPVVVLMHQPDVADFVARNPQAILQLSGHTHGGQMRIPGIRPIYLPHFGQKYIQGLHRIDNLWLYVNRGIGLSRMGPLRINCPPEITLLTLKATSRNKS